jgi:hypothetical protein
MAVAQAPAVVAQTTVDPVAAVNNVVGNAVGVVRDDQGRFAAAAAPAAVESAVADEPDAKRARIQDPMSFLNSLSTTITDAGTMQQIADYIAAQLEENVNNKKEMQALHEAKAILEKAQNAHVESSKNVVKDVVETLSSLYELYGQQKIADQSRAKLTNILTSDPEALDAMRPILVAASAIHKSAGAHALAARDDALKQTLAKVGVLQNQLSAVRHLNSPASAPVAAAIAPQWTTAAPAVEVAASAMSAPAPAAHTATSFRVPDILRTMPKFHETPGVGRVGARDFSRAMEK